MIDNVKNISIIGLGLIGGSIAKALKNTDTSYNISAYDKEEVLERAIAENVIDSKLKSIDSALDSEILILSLPIEKNLEIFALLAPHLQENQIITDVSGIKLPFQKIWENVNSNGIYVGGHPMTGKEKGGYENSDPLLFENSVYILTEKLEYNQKLGGLRLLIEQLGANILHIPAKQHDVIAASVSHLPQLIAVTLVNTAALKTDEYNFLDLAAGGFRDLTRIASSEFNIWDQVIHQNKNQIISAIEEFSYELDVLKKWISNDKVNDLSNYFETARKSRAEIPKNSKGFLTPVYDVFIFVKDEPGVISKISTKLFESDINIKDIELLKIREGNGGTFRLSFESEDTAEKAKLVLSDIGFKFRD